MLSANRLALDLGVPSGRITDILNGRRSITADTAVRLGRYFGNSAQFWLDLQSQHDIAVVEKEKGAEIKERVRPARWLKMPEAEAQCLWKTTPIQCGSDHVAEKYLPASCQDISP